MNRIFDNDLQEVEENIQDATESLVTYVSNLNSHAQDIVNSLLNDIVGSMLQFGYPTILIDEYQDSFKVVIEKFVNKFIEPQEGPQFGFFGDSWQTIYASNGACGIIEHANIKEIKKKSNFRSQQVIVDVLNKIRPELPQISAINERDGEVFADI